jgi:hypothetical protein
MATSVERMRAHRERARRGLRRLAATGNGRAADFGGWRLMSARTISARLRNAAMRAPQAPTTISRRGPSPSSSPTPFCKSNPALQTWRRHFA